MSAETVVVMSFVSCCSSSTSMALPRGCESDGSGSWWLRLNDRDVRPAILEILMWAKWIMCKQIG